MNELPECLNIAGQINETVNGKRITGVTASHTPHKLVWYFGKPPEYPDLLAGKTIGEASAHGGMVEIKAGNANILFGEGVGIRFHEKNEPRPAKHQLLIDFADGSALSGAVKMFGGLGAFKEGECDNPYYKTAKEKIPPFSAAFDDAYFNSIISANTVQKLSLKALLATEQRIPGLGNGILQDILFNGKMHPKKKVNSLSLKDRENLYYAVKTTIAAMAAQGGRDMELDLFGNPGGYKTVLSKNTVNKPCPVCGTIIKKETYLGGSVYFCEMCQKL
jgi:formamidopyrimidine-DNA glycosylase